MTSTVSGNGDPGADPNKVMVVVDRLASTDATTGPVRSFIDFDSAQAGEVLRGVSFTPRSDLGGFRLLF